MTPPTFPLPDLRALRKARNLSIERAAVAAGISGCWLRQIERDPRLLTQRVAERLLPVLGGGALQPSPPDLGSARPVARHATNRGPRPAGRGTTPSVPPLAAQGERMSLDAVEDARELALRVMELRVARGVRHRDLARAAGLSDDDLQDMFLAKLPFTTPALKAIARALEAPPGWPDEVPGVLPTEPVALTYHPTPEEEARNAKTRSVITAALEEIEDAMAALRSGDVSTAVGALARSGRLARSVAKDEDD